MIVTCNSLGIKSAAKAIKNGGIVIFPTDTVYGIGCDPYNAEAVKLIFKLKQRNETKPLPLLAFSQQEISKVAYFDDLSVKIAKKFWPGPVTLVLKIKDSKLKQTLKLDDIAVRVPNNRCVLKLLKKCKLIVGTSANISETPSSPDPKKVVNSISGYDVFLDGGKIVSLGESTVLKVKKGKIKIIRPGIVSQKEFADLF